MVEADTTLDCMGLFCPIPIVKTSEKFRELKVGEVLEVISDDPGIKMDMPAWCKSTGNELVGIEEKEGVYKVYVRKVKD